MRYQDLKQIKDTLEKYQITDLKMLDKEIEKAGVEYRAVLEAEIADLQAKIQTAESNLIAVPVGVDERVVALVMEASARSFSETVLLRDELERKQNLLTELKAL